MAGQTGSAEEGFILLFIYFPSLTPTAEPWFLHLHHPDMTMEDFMIVEGQRDLASWVGGEAGGGDDLERNLNNNVLTLQYQFVPTSKDWPHCDHSLCKVEPNPN